MLGWVPWPLFYESEGGGLGGGGGGGWVLLMGGGGGGLGERLVCGVIDLFSLSASMSS